MSRTSQCHFHTNTLSFLKLIARKQNPLYNSLLLQVSLEDGGTPRASSKQPSPGKLLTNFPPMINHPNGGKRVVFNEH